MRGAEARLGTPIDAQGLPKVSHEGRAPVVQQVAGKTVVGDCHAKSIVRQEDGVKNLFIDNGSKTARSPARPIVISAATSPASARVAASLDLGSRDSQAPSQWSDRE